MGTQPLPYVSVCAIGLMKYSDVNMRRDHVCKLRGHMHINMAT